jgi:hypothetical protein
MINPINWVVPSGNPNLLGVTLFKLIEKILDGVVSIFQFNLYSKQHKNRWLLM